MAKSKRLGWREQTRRGYTLHFTGQETHIGLMDDIIDEIERWFGRG